jgi:hypothetical protein
METVMKKTFGLNEFLAIVEADAEELEMDELDLEYAMETWCKGGCDPARVLEAHADYIYESAMEDFRAERDLGAAL